MNEYDVALRAASNLRSLISELKAKGASEALDALEESLKTGQKAAHEDSDPLVRVARGEALTPDLLEALSPTL